MRIVTICGSTSQRDDINELNRRLTMRGDIVLAPGVFQHDGDPLSDADKIRLDELHLKKIDLSSAVYIIPKSDGSLGTSTFREFQYAVNHDKTIRVILDVRHSVL